jgi:ABC-type Fe3+-hydroxamate transport system substrate-binding protein
VPRFRVVATLLVAVALTAACGTKPEPRAEPTRFPVVVKDAVDVDVRLDRAPARITTTDVGAANVLRELGLGDRVAEVEAPDLARSIAGTEPDLIVIPLDAAAPPASAVPVFRYGAATIDRAPLAISRLGLVVGRGPEAAAIAQRLGMELEDLRVRVAEQEPVPTLIEGEGFVGLGPDTSLGAAVAFAGGANLISRTQTLDPAAIARLQPVAWVAAEPGGSPLAALRSFPDLTTVPAVETGRVIPAPAAGYPVDGSLARALDELARALRAQSGS